MHTISYEIKIDDKDEFVQLKLDADTLNSDEDKFFILQMAAHLINKIRTISSYQKFDTELKEEIDITEEILLELSHIFIEKIKNRVRVGDFVLGKDFDAYVNNIDERNALDQSFFFKDNFLQRSEGLRILVIDEMKIYTLVKGIGNENWS